MMCSTASSMPRFSDMPDNITRRPSAPRLAKDGFDRATVSANPSRSRPANHVLARCGGAPTSWNLAAIGAMSDKVSLTSNTNNAGRRMPSGLSGWSMLGIDSVNLLSSLLTLKPERLCPASTPVLLRQRARRSLSTLIISNEDSKAWSQLCVTRERPRPALRSVA